MSVTNKCAKISEELLIQEKYSSGWRGAPAKGVDRLRGARVQIPPSPFSFRRYFFMPLNSKMHTLKKWIKKVLTKKEKGDMISDVAAVSRFEKISTKVSGPDGSEKVEKSAWHAQEDVLDWASWRGSAAGRTLIIEQWQPWKFERISSGKRT